MKISKKPKYRQDNSDINTNENQRYQSSSQDYCSSQAFIEQQQQLAKMQLLYDRNANEDAMISGQFPNSTANFTIETINGNEHSNTPGGSVATDVVRSIEHGDYSS